MMRAVEFVAGGIAAACYIAAPCLLALAVWLDGDAITTAALLVAAPALLLLSYIITRIFNLDI